MFLKDGEKNSTHKTPDRTMYIFLGWPQPPPPFSLLLIPTHFHFVPCPLIHAYLLSPDLPPSSCVGWRKAVNGRMPTREELLPPPQGLPPSVPCMVCGRRARDERMKVNSSPLIGSSQPPFPSRSRARSVLRRLPRRIRGRGGRRLFKAVVGLPLGM